MSEIEKQVVKLVDAAAAAAKSEDAVRFAQAALNAAHAQQVLATIKAAVASG